MNPRTRRERINALSAGASGGCPEGGDRWEAPEAVLLGSGRGPRCRRCPPDSPASISAPRKNRWLVVAVRAVRTALEPAAAARGPDHAGRDGRDGGSAALAHCWWARRWENADWWRSRQYQRSDEPAPSSATRVEARPRARDVARNDFETTQKCSVVALEDDSDARLHPPGSSSDARSVGDFVTPLPDSARCPCRMWHHPSRSCPSSIFPV